jgi:hypothetical protein
MALKSRGFVPVFFFLNFFPFFVDCVLFYFLLKYLSLTWRCHHCQYRAAKFRHVLGSYALWIKNNLYGATTAVKQDLRFCSLVHIEQIITRGPGAILLTWVILPNISHIFTFTESFLLYFFWNWHGFYLKL